MKYVHAFWSKPLLNSKFFDTKTALAITLVEYALSVQFVHDNGYDIYLYTDSEGAKILEPIPYDKVIIINPTIDNYHFAASFKFEALKQMDLDDCLIDGDLFLMKGRSYAEIQSSKADIITSTFEDHKFISNQQEKFEKLMKDLQEFKFEAPYETPSFEDCDGWLNTSLMKFNNQELKDAYIEQYFKYADIVKDKDFDKNWPDIIIEQRHLTQLIRSKDYTYETIVPDYGSEEGEEYATKIGFAHVGSAKIAFLPSAIHLLELKNKELLLKLDKHITNYLKKK